MLHPFTCDPAMKAQQRSLQPGMVMHRCVFAVRSANHTLLLQSWSPSTLQLRQRTFMPKHRKGLQLVSATSAHASTIAASTQQFPPASSGNGSSRPDLKLGQLVIPWRSFHYLLLPATALLGIWGNTDSYGRPMLLYVCARYILPYTVIAAVTRKVAAAWGKLSAVGFCGVALGCLKLLHRSLSLGPHETHFFDYGPAPHEHYLEVNLPERVFDWTCEWAYKDMLGNMMFSVGLGCAVLGLFTILVATVKRFRHGKQNAKMVAENTPDKASDGSPLLPSCPAQSTSHVAPQPDKPLPEGAAAKAGMVDTDSSAPAEALRAAQDRITQLERQLEAGKLRLMQELKGYGDAWREEVKEVEMDLTAMTEQRDALLRERDDLTIKSKSTEHEKAHLERQLGIADGAAAAHKKANDALAGKMVSVQFELNLLKEEHNNLLAGHSIQTQERNRLQAELYTLKEEHKSLQGEHSALAKAHGRLQAERDGLLEELSSLETQRDGLLDKCSGLRAQMGGLQEAHDGQQAERDRLEQERDDLEEQRDSLLREREEQRDSLLRERDELKEQRNGAMLERDNLQFVLERLKEELNTLGYQRTVEKKELVRERDDLKQQWSGLVVERDNLLYVRSCLEEARDTLVNEHYRLKMERDGLVEERARVVKESAYREGRNQALVEERDRLLEERRWLRAQLGEGPQDDRVGQ